ncbi:MAG: KTSC domain-containing protein [Alphaproteobacteria bacterium]|nr:KTSC domain-containing protein [Alphaproteobacteria bacterium]MCW5739417.1 KTSC domain-containing protein [Alphaproteobacteria bacterium]
MPSTVIRSYRYNPKRRELTIVFPSGASYTYLRVPTATHLELNAAPSKGEYFNAQIRNRFAFIRNTSTLERRRLPAS